jgi:hypothetical protein
MQVSHAMNHSTFVSTSYIKEVTFHRHRLAELTSIVKHSWYWAWAVVQASALNWLTTSLTLPQVGGLTSNVTDFPSYIRPVADQMHPPRHFYDVINCSVQQRCQVMKMKWDHPSSLRSLNWLKPDYVRHIYATCHLARRLLFLSRHHQHCHFSGGL